MKELSPDIFVSKAYTFNDSTSVCQNVLHGLPTSKSPQMLIKNANSIAPLRPSESVSLR